MGLDFEQVKMNRAWKCWTCIDSCCCNQLQCTARHRHCFTYTRTRKRYEKAKRIRLQQRQQRQNRQREKALQAEASYVAVEPQSVCSVESLISAPICNPPSKEQQSHSKFSVRPFVNLPPTFHFGTCIHNRVFLFSDDLKLFRTVSLYRNFWFRLPPGR